MPTALFRTGMHMLTALCFLLVVLIVIDKGLPSFAFADTAHIQSFKTLFISIFLEAIPFILLGVLLSSLLQVFVSERTVQRWIPKHPLLGIVFACLLGLLFPVCECGMIPIVRRLMLKGMPAYVAAVFILTGPIINPVVFAATFMAFRSDPFIAYARMGLAFAVAAAIGLLLYRFLRSSPLRVSRATMYGQEAADGHEHSGGRWSAFFGHAADEFFEMGKFLAFGAFITAIIQTYMDRASLVDIGQGPLSSHLFMMGFAYVLSLCSTSDAFVASSFQSSFTRGSLLTFLVFGPMLDFKNTLMLLSVFKTKFVLILSLLIAAAVLAGSLLLERLS